MWGRDGNSQRPVVAHPQALEKNRTMGSVRFDRGRAVYPGDEHSREIFHALKMAGCQRGCPQSGLGLCRHSRPGVALVADPFRYKAAEAATEQAEVSAKLEEHAQKSHLTERFAKAVELLGRPDSLTVRVGGIYALEKIAQEDPETYHKTVYELLVTFVRQRASGSAPALNETSESIEGSWVSRDVQIAMTIIGRRNLEYEEKRGGAGFSLAKLLDFSGLNLRGVVLDDLTFESADFHGAHLKSAQFTNSNLNNAKFWFSNCDLENFSGASLDSTDF